MKKRKPKPTITPEEAAARLVAAALAHTEALDGDCAGVMTETEDALMTAADAYREVVGDG